MKSIFSELPNNIIIYIIQIENDRRKCEEAVNRKKYEEVVKQLDRVTTWNGAQYRGLDHSVRSTFNRGGDGLSASGIWCYYSSGEFEWMDEMAWVDSRDPPVGGW